MTVYIDVLFIINFAVNYVLLLITGRLMRHRINKARVFAAAMGGALYACFMFFPQIKFLYGFIFKILASFVLVLGAYGIKSIVMSIKNAVVFYLSSFVFGGVTLAVFYFTDAGLKYGGALNNGIFYFNLPWKILFLSCALSYAAVKLAFFIYRRDKKLTYEKVTVAISENFVHLNALVDTGNLLSDPITNSPVVVVELEGIKELLPQKLVKLFKDKNETDLQMVSEAVKNTELEKRLRMIPFSSLGEQNGIMLGFKPDFVKIEKSVISEVCIGICGANLSNGHAYNALIGPEVFEAKAQRQ